MICVHVDHIHMLHAYVAYQLSLIALQVCLSWVETGTQCPGNSLHAMNLVCMKTLIEF